MNKIAIYLISDGMGGAEQVVWQSIYGLSKYASIYLIVNNEIVSYYSDLLPHDRIFNIGDIYLHLNPKYRFIRYLINNRFFSIKPFLVKSKTKKITEYLKVNNIRIVHAHLEYALFSSLKIKIGNNLKLIYTVHSAFGLLSDKSLRPQIALKNINFSTIDTMIFVSKYLYTIYKLNNIPIKEYRIIYNGLENSHFINFHREEVRNDLLTILYVGGSKFVKGFDLLVETVEKLIKIHKQSKFRVIVLGALSPHSELVQLMNERSLSHVFEIVGFVNPPLHLEYFKTSDLLFMPSRSEAMPMAAIEALYADLPIIASNVGGLPEIVENGENGFMCNVDADEFASILVYVLNNYSHLLQKTIKYNIKKKNLFEISKMCEQIRHCLL